MLLFVEGARKNQSLVKDVLLVKLMKRCFGRSLIDATRIGTLIREIIPQRNGRRKHG